MKKAKGFIRAIQEFMDSAKGKTTLNYLYSWGAAIVILGTLFKLTHMSGANIMLFVGMGTEVLVFFFSAFERPYEVAEEEKREEAVAGGMASSGPIIIGGPFIGGQPATNNATVSAQPNESVTETTEPVQAQPVAATAPAATPVTTGSQVPYSGAPIIIGGGAPATTPVQTPNLENIGEMDKATEDYVEKVRALTEAIKRISEQTEALGSNMQEMETLSRNLTGVNALYEIQLRSAGGQLDAIDKVNEQTKIMATQVEELNKLYARMIEAMTTNMNRSQM